MSGKTSTKELDMSKKQYLIQVLQLFRKPRNQLWLIGTIVLFVFAYGAYFAKSIDAYVVDELTGKPVAGANVIAHWVLIRRGMHAVDFAGTLELKEAVTDKNGHFHIDGWGPRFALMSHLESRDPSVTIFHPDYKIHSEGSDYGLISYSHSILRSSPMDGKTIKLKRSNESPLNRFDSLDFYYLWLDRALMKDSELCQAIPQLVQSIREELDRIKVQLPQDQRSRTTGIFMLGNRGC